MYNYEKIRFVLELMQQHSHQQHISKVSGICCGNKVPMKAIIVQNTFFSIHKLLLSIFFQFILAFIIISSS